MNTVLIWSGEHKAYWRPNGQGYTEKRPEAGRYALAEAEAIVKSCSGKKLKIQAIPEKPLLFKPEMVRAILAGRKTMTRRLVASVLGIGPVTEFGPSNTRGYDWTFLDSRLLWNDLRHNDLLERCPYGQVGDHLWGRESFDFYPDGNPGEQDNCQILYWADGSFEQRTAPADYNPYLYGHEKVRPSIHLPRWASRILLEITDVRLEQIQAITEEDAMAEGAHWVDCGLNRWNQANNGWSMLDPHPRDAGQCLGSARFAFANYINELHGGPNWDLKPDNLWDENPWVWAISYKRLEAHHG